MATVRKALIEQEGLQGAFIELPSSRLVVQMGMELETAIGSVGSDRGISVL